jgi:hypothetical protein
MSLQDMCVQDAAGSGDINQLLYAEELWVDHLAIFAQNLCILYQLIGILVRFA